MSNLRWDETWHRLQYWTDSSGKSERLAVQILLADGFESLDPSHPLGGPDGGKDAKCKKDGLLWVMAVYFPRGELPFKDIKKKFKGDLKGVHSEKAQGFVFVTNQKIELAERNILKSLGQKENVSVELYHIESIVSLLDSAKLLGIRKQFLGIDFTENLVADQVTSLQNDIAVIQKRNEGLQTGGDSFCYFMLYTFDMQASVARQLVIIRQGEFGIPNLRFRVRDMLTEHDILQENNWGKLNGPAEYKSITWPLASTVYYRIFFNADNGSWNQDLILRRSDKAQCWLAATRVFGRDGRDVVFTRLDNEFEAEFGLPEWME